MSWSSMAARVTGSTPVPYPHALQLVQDSWKEVQRSFIWSFLWGDYAVPTPNPVGAGTVTLTPGTPIVIGDAAASAAWALTGLVNPLTLRQFRVGQGTIYNILAYDTTTNSPFGTLTLATPFVDPVTGTGPTYPNIGYQIIQSYYIAPAADFLWWESLRDPVSGYVLSTTMTREEVDEDDPQRFQSGWPRAVIPYAIYNVPGPKFGWPMYEIWPAPLNSYTYVGSAFRGGLPFASASDTVNPQLGEDIVIERAKMYAYEWAMANSDKVPKGDYRFLYAATDKRFTSLLDVYALKDEELSHRHKISHADSAFTG